MSWPRLSEPSHLALKYAILAGIWIIASDYFLSLVPGDSGPSTVSNIAKGLTFVAVTCIVLWLLAARMQSRMHEAEKARREELHQANAQLQRAKGMHAALVRANQAALTATEEKALLREISEAMVGLAGLRLVRFSWVDEATHRVVPVSWAGAAQDYIAGMRCSVDPHDPFGQGPTGRAIRESTSIVCQEMLSDPALEPWRERIKVHGFRSCMAIPLKLGERRGAITAFAGEPAFFDPEIADLMHRLVADLQHGLQLIIDRADRARVEQNLRENEARLRALFDSHHMAMLLIDPLTCTVEEATPASARILNTPLETLKTQPLETNPLWTERGLREAAGQALRHDRAETAQLTIPLSDDANLQLSATLSPFPFRDGVRLLCTLEDVTEKLRAIERLHLVQTAIEAAPTGFVIADALGHVQWVNPAFTAMTGYSLEHVVGRTPGILKSGRQDSQFYDHLWKTISRGKTWEGDLQNQRRDGAIYWEHMIIAPVVRPNGTIMHYVAIKQDITAQKDMENQVARTQRLESIGLLAGGIAHDLNNVLAPILMAMDLFKLRYPDPADQARFEMVRKSAERGAGIVRQVLTFARGVDGERMSLRPEHLLKEVRNLLQETLHRNIEIDFNVPGDLPSIVGDPTQLHQVLLNLGVNARDAMPKGGLLTLSAGLRNLSRQTITSSGLPIPPGDYIALVVRDTGEGIPPSLMERIFEPFFTTKPRGAGTGLGLSTVIGIVRGHGGGLEVESTQGVGTEMCILLPSAASADTSVPHAQPRTNLTGDGRTILVVDDEEPMRAVIGMALDLQGFTHVDAQDGVHAMEIFERAPDRFAAVILDQMMPRLGGDEVTARLRSMRPNLPIVLITGILKDEGHGNIVRVAAEKSDVVELKKPFAQADLIAALARAMG